MLELEYEWVNTHESVKGLTKDEVQRAIEQKTFYHSWSIFFNKKIPTDDDILPSIRGTFAELYKDVKGPEGERLSKLLKSIPKAYKTSDEYKKMLNALADKVRDGLMLSYVEGSYKIKSYMMSNGSTRWVCSLKETIPNPKNGEDLDIVIFKKSSSELAEAIITLEDIELNFQKHVYAEKRFNRMHIRSLLDSQIGGLSSFWNKLPITQLRDVTTHLFNELNKTCAQRQDLIDKWFEERYKYLNPDYDKDVIEKLKCIESFVKEENLKYVKS